MHCPYCAEEIKDEAIVCRYCRQNLVFFKPIEQRLKTVEDRLSEIAVTLKEATSFANAKPSTSAISDSTLAGGFPKRKVAIAIAVSVMFTAVITGVYMHLALWEYRAVLYVLFIFSQSLGGIWLGITWPKSHLKIYIISGLTVGVMDMLAIALFASELPPSLAYYLYIIAPPTLMFVSSSLFGDLIERKLYPNRSQTGYAEQLSVKLIAGSKGSGNRVGGAEAGYEERVRRVAGFISALAPILTLLGTIITGILTYLAAIRKAVP